MPICRPKAIFSIPDYSADSKHTNQISHGPRPKLFKNLEKNVKVVKVAKSWKKVVFLITLWIKTSSSLPLS